MAVFLNAQLLIFATVVLLGLFSVQPTCGQLTIPKRQLGFVYNGYGTGNPPVTISFYIDNTCDNSQAAYPTMIKVADYFGPESVMLVTHLFSLPYHRNSHTIAKGAHVIDAYSKGVATYAWFKIIYDNLNNLTTAATVNLTDVQVMDILAPLAETVSQIPQNEFRTQVQNNSSIELSAKLGWKYCCTRGLYGTPMFMVNDILIAADSSWNVDQWILLIKSLLPKPEL